MIAFARHQARNALSVFLCALAAKHKEGVGERAARSHAHATHLPPTTYNWLGPPWMQRPCAHAPGALSVHALLAAFCAALRAVVARALRTRPTSDVARRHPAPSTQHSSQLTAHALPLRPLRTRARWPPLALAPLLPDCSCSSALVAGSLSRHRA